MANADERVVPSSREEVLLSFAPVVKKAAPAVVNIYSKRIVRQERRLPPLFDDPLFKRFFGDFFGESPLPRRRMESSLGSGVIVSSDGLVVTNNHVIEGATAIKVVLSDMREFAAEVALIDERTDIAVLRIQDSGGDLPFLELKDSDDVEVGDIVLALGNPFGVGRTVTSGIVSALARTKVGITDYSFFIQTDAAINPGNSGGPLVTLDGRIVGINTAIFSRSGGSVGIGFAIPSNMVRTVIAGVDSGGKVVRGWIGVKGQTITADLAEGLQRDRPGGVIVSDVHPRSPAAEAGVRKGDVILGVGGKSIADLEALRYRIATRKPGGEVALSLLRGNRSRAVEVGVAMPPEVPPRDTQTLSGRHPLKGTRIANLSPALSEELDMPGMWDGIVITEVRRGAPAQRFGFRPGDVVLSVNGKSIASARDLAQTLEHGPASPEWLIRFRRGERVLAWRIGR